MSLVPLMLMGMAVAQGQLPEEFYYDFRGGKELPPLFNYPGKWMQPEPAGLHVNLPAERNNLTPMALVTKFAVRGDFEITATYKINNAEEPDSGFGVGLTLKVEKARPAQDSATVGRVHRADGRQVAIWDRGLDVGDKKVKMKGGEVHHAAMDGRLRLKRTGGTLEFLVAQGTEDNFYSLSQCDFGTEDLEKVLLQAVTSRQKRALDAHWIDLRIQSAGLPAVASPPGNPMAFWLAIGVPGTGALAGGGFWWWRRRKNQPGNLPLRSQIEEPKKNESKKEKKIRAIDRRE